MAKQLLREALAAGNPKIIGVADHKQEGTENKKIQGKLIEMDIKRLPLVLLRELELVPTKNSCTKSYQTAR